MGSVGSVLVRGAIAGAAGTTALNAVTFADMALRGRPASTTPQDTVDRGLALLGTELPGDRDEKEARSIALGSLLGVAAGTAVGVAVAALRASGWPTGRTATAATTWMLVMIAGNGPMTALGVTDPRTWAATDWAADVMPHAAYAVAASAALRGLLPTR